jgi:hypothetical protein
MIRMGRASKRWHRVTGLWQAVAALSIMAVMMVSVVAAIPAIAVAQEYTVDTAASEALTNYLRQNRLPLVGAQIGTAPSGARRLVLYGYVATDVGKSNAESKALANLGSPKPEVVNRIVIKPEIAQMKSDGQAGSQADSSLGSANAYASSGQGPSGAFPGESFDKVIDDINRYGIRSPAGDDPGAP